jgi:hypothetical protein
MAFGIPWDGFRQVHNRSCYVLQADSFVSIDVELYCYSLCSICHFHVEISTLFLLITNQDVDGIVEAL